MFKLTLTAAAATACVAAAQPADETFAVVDVDAVDVQAPLTKPPTGEVPTQPRLGWQQGLAAAEHALNATSGSCTWATYKQCDAAWAHDQLGTSSNTICSAGCAMSSLAMYLSTRGHHYSPKSLNSWLKSHGGYADGDLLVWGSVDSMGVSYQGQEKGVSVDVLTKGLEECHGIIANVRGGSHWVLLTGHVSGTTFSVHDPGFNQATYDTSEMLVFAVYH